MKRQRLCDERKRVAKTQHHAALEIGISPIYLRKLESGEVNPGRSVMFRLCDYYKVEAKSLFPDLVPDSHYKKFIAEEESKS